MKKLRDNIFKVSSNGVETDLDVEQVQELIDERNHLLRTFEIVKNINVYLKKKVDELEKEVESLSHMINVQEL